jgi:hypothetical protein
MDMLTHLTKKHGLIGPEASDTTVLAIALICGIRIVPRLAIRMGNDAPEAMQALLLGTLARNAPG